MRKSRRQHYHPHNNPVRGRFNAWLLDHADETMHNKYGERKRKFFSDLPQTIVEIGIGPGTNLRYYNKETTVIAVEPNLLMHDRLRARADEFKIDLKLKTFCGEELDLVNNSAEAVVGTLVLCTVHNPAKVLSEVLRILKPAGKFVFLEHVAAPANSGLGLAQRILRRPWAWCGEGCQLNRHTERLLQKAGFTNVELETFRLDTFLFPVSPHIAGVAIK